MQMHGADYPELRYYLLFICLCLESEVKYSCPFSL